MSGSRHPATALCGICGRSFPVSELVGTQAVRGSVGDLIRRDYPEWPADGLICRPDLNRYRARYVQDLLEAERGELGEVEKRVVQGLREMELVATDVNKSFERELTFGERLADRVASFGGSWTFILIFGGILCCWIFLNAVILLRDAFDPYPFILLNLVLSCLAALQAPVIMMSQNRQQAKDRMRAEHDYEVNLKAELEIRLLGERLDRLLTHQWQRLLDIQQIQVELMQGLDPEGGHPRKRGAHEPPA